VSVCFGPWRPLRGDRGRTRVAERTAGKPAGAVRITTAEHAANTVLWPKLAKLLPDYPDIQVEITIDYGLIDIVAERYDAGVRLGEEVAKDMIAVRIGPDLRMAVVGLRPTSRGDRRRGRRRTWPPTTASICGCRPMVGFLLGNSSERATR